MRLSNFLLFFVCAMLLSLAMKGQQPALTIDRSPGPARLGVTGNIGQEYILQGSTNAQAGWDFLLKLPLTNSPQNWLDAVSSLLPMRLYRALESTEPVEVANDFRLIDHLGRPHWLFY